jgi:alkylation response protein AidB-like acyl-CoA dehydrogenase
VTSLLSKTNQNQAELALEWMLSRANDPRKMPFGKLLSEHATIIEGIARSRIEIDAARLMVLNAAHTIDETDAKTALKEIAEIKVLIPAMALTVIDRAVQSFGGEGSPRTHLWHICGPKPEFSGSQMALMRCIYSSLAEEKTSGVPKC